MEKRLVTVTEAAALLGCSRAHIYTRVMSGEIPSIKIGRARRIPLAALEQWIQRQLEEADAGEEGPNA